MKKFFLILIPLLMLLTGLYFLSGWSKQTRSRIWNAFDQDTLYLNDNTCVRGWVWTETEEAVMGKKDNGDLFTIRRLELKGIERNLLVTQLKQIL